MKKLIACIFLIMGYNMSFAATNLNRLSGEILDGDFLDSDKKTIKRDYLALLGDCSSLDRTGQENAMVALKTLGDYCYKNRTIDQAAQYYTLALSILEDSELTSFLESKGIYRPYSKDRIGRGLEKSVLGE